MIDIEQLNRKVEALETRNQRVEADKKWETSYTRRSLLFLFTYIAIGLYLWVISVTHPWLNAIVPSVGFILSTLTLPYFKKLWLNNKNRPALAGLGQHLRDNIPSSSNADD